MHCINTGYDVDRSANLADAALRKGQYSRQNPSNTNNFSRLGTPINNAHQSGNLA
jgi:hypothetical protein